MYRQYTQRNKYNAVKTMYNGYRYDSKFEASIAYELDMRQKAGEFTSWERQYKCEMWAYTADGQKAIKMNHKVDFRILHLDNSYELYEAKGVETTDYRIRRKWLEKLWLPEHPDHTYTVVKQSSRRYR